MKKVSENFLAKRLSDFNLIILNQRKWKNKRRDRKRNTRKIRKKESISQEEIAFLRGKEIFRKSKEEREKE